MTESQAALVDEPRWPGQTRVATAACGASAVEVEGSRFLYSFLRRALAFVQEGRAVDQGVDRLFRTGRVPFFLGSAGHEVAQVAAALALRPGADWFFPYYRDSAFVLALGHSMDDHLLSLMAGRDDPSSGGRQGPNHWGLRDLNVVAQSSCAGTQFLQAAGVAEAITRDASGAVVYVSSGEGTTSQGEFYEAVSWAALHRLPVIFFVQDNGYAISTPVAEQTPGGSISHNLASMSGIAVQEVDGTDFFATFAAMRVAASRARIGEGPSLLHARVLRLGSHSSADAQGRYRSEDEMRAEQDRDPVPRFERTLVRIGVLDAVEVTEGQARAAARFEHALASTRTSEPHDGGTVEWHVHGASHVAGGGDLHEPAAGIGEPARMLDAIRDAIAAEMAREPRIVLFGEDVANAHGGVFGATRGLVSEFGPTRVFNSPLAEAAIVGVGIGMAIAGWRPIVEIQFGDYIFPAMMQIRSELAMLRYRSRGTWTCPLVIRAAVGGYIGGGHYHSQSIESFFTHLPGLRVVQPSNAHDAVGLLRAALRGDDPVLFLEHKALYRSAAAARPAVPSDAIVPLGRAVVCREGTDVTIVTYGALVRKALDAADTLASGGVQCEVIDLRTLAPLDEEAILRSVRKTGRLIVAHEAPLTGGFGAEIAARASGACWRELRAPVQRVGARDTPVPCAPDLEHVVLPQVADLLRAIRDVVRASRDAQ